MLVIKKYKEYNVCKKKRKAGLHNMKKELIPVLVEMIRTHPSYTEQHKKDLINVLENKVTDE